MGTNYEWHETCPAPCDHCGLTPIHVGKSSAGWSFGFRAYRHDPDDGMYSPFGRSVLSRVDWQEIFASRQGHLIDEYGREAEDPIAWLNDLPAPDAAQQAKEWSREWMGAYWQLDPAREWRDAEGFRFYLGEFS